MMNTYSKAFISDWQTAAKLIIKHTQLIKKSSYDQEQSLDEPMTLLSDRQIQDALEGPYSAFFKQILTNYAQIVKLRYALNTEEQEIFKSGSTSSPNEFEVPKKILEKISSPDLSQLQDELSKLAESHNEQWESHIALWKQLIVEKLTEADIQLSDIEIRELQDEEPISELEDRLVDLHIDTSKAKNTDINFMNYFTMKAQITIQSALSRQHKPHEPQDIKRVLKLLKPVFDTVHKEEKKLLSEQQAAIKQTLQSIQY